MRHNRGMTALSTVLVVSAVLLSLLITVTYLSVGEAQSGLADFKSQSRLALLDGCAEDILQKIHDNPVLVGAINRPEGTCTIAANPPGTGPTNWDLTISTDAADFPRKLRVTFTRGETAITNITWQEI